MRQLAARPQLKRDPLGGLMGHLRSLTNLTVEVNSKHLGSWPFKIGEYMLNFAALELISYQYLDALEATREDFNRNLDRFLSGRI